MTTLPIAFGPVLSRRLARVVHDGTAYLRLDHVHTAERSTP